ncbi:MAG: glucosamine-6-phosphate deaminase [Ruminococcaceae bacterium]|nr:glucosamine-6-phosphate deaminase [Oscillospiraceae bacterium]
MLKNMKVDLLNVEVYESRPAMGAAAAADAARVLKELLAEKDEINVMFAAAPSQNEVLASLVADKSIDWTRVNAFHMDEYINLAADAPQGFGNFLRDRIFGLLPFKSVSYLNGNNPDIEAETERYSALLAEHPLDVCMLGVGENGHIAFNDPPVANFDDPKAVKIVELDQRCRQQQVNDGCFAAIDEVPTHALTVTIPGMTSAKYMFCVVPAPTKAEAIGHMLKDEISTACPATILRRHEGAKLYLDPDSASLVL